MEHWRRKKKEKKGGGGGGGDNFLFFLIFSALWSRLSLSLFSLSLSFSSLLSSTLLLSANEGTLFFLPLFPLPSNRRKKEKILSPLLSWNLGVGFDDRWTVNVFCTHSPCSETKIFSCEVSSVIGSELLPFPSSNLLAISLPPTPPPKKKNPPPFSLINLSLLATEVRRINPLSSLLFSFSYR